MADGLNKVILIGRLGADPELRFTQGGKAVMEIRLACSESWADKSGQRQERTEWISATVWEKRAEGLAKVLHKGDLIYIEGPLRTTSYDDRDGNKRYRTFVDIRDVKLLGGKGGGQRGAAPAQEEPQGGGGYGGGYGAGQGDDQIPF